MEYRRVNLKLSSSQFNKLNDASKSNNGTTLRIGNKNFNKGELLYELLLTQTQIKELRNKIESNMSADIKLGRAQINKILKSGGASGSVLARFLPKLIKPVISLGKNILAPLGLSAAMSATDAAIHKDIQDITKIVKVLKDSDVLMKGVTETFKSEIKNLHSKKGGDLPILPMLLRTLGSTLIGNLLTGKELFRTGSGNKWNCGQGMYRAGQGLKKKVINSFSSFNKL